MADRKSTPPTLEGESMQLSFEGSDHHGGGGSYEIRVQGHLDDHWSQWLGGLAIDHDSEGFTLLTGEIPDQAALHGLLVKIRDLGLLLVSLRRIAPF